MQRYYTYILKGVDGRYYYGSCENLDERLSDHNHGKVKSTKYRRPLVVHYFETHNSRSEAFKREMFFKSIDGYIWLKTEKII